MEQPLESKGNEPLDNEPTDRHADASFSESYITAAATTSQLAPLRADEQGASAAARGSNVNRQSTASATTLALTHVSWMDSTSSSAPALAAAFVCSGAPGSCSVEGSPAAASASSHATLLHVIADGPLKDVASASAAASSSTAVPSSWLVPVSDVRSPTEALADYCSSARLQSALGAVLQQIHPLRQLTTQLATLLTDTLLLALAEGLLAEPQPRSVADVERRVDELMIEELAKHAKLELAKQLDPSSSAIVVQQAFTSHGGLNYFGSLVLPLLPASCGSPPLSPLVCVAVTTMLKYIAAEVLELSSNECDKHLTRNVNAAIVLLAVAKDEEVAALVERLGVADAFKQVPDAATLVQRFPKAQTLLQQLCKQYAWFHHQPTVELVLHRFLRGELPLGDRHYWQRLHIRPVAYFGRHNWPLVPADEWRLDNEPAASDSDDDDDEDAVRRAMSALHRSLAVELVDSSGREYGVVIQISPEHGGSATVLSQPGGTALASAGKRSGTHRLQLTQAATTHFAAFEPHQFTPEQWQQWEAEHTQQWSSAQRSFSSRVLPPPLPDDATPEERKQWEIAHCWLPPCAWLTGSRTRRRCFSSTSRWPCAATSRYKRCASASMQSRRRPLRLQRMAQWRQPLLCCRTMCCG